MPLEVLDCLHFLSLFLLPILMSIILLSFSTLLPPSISGSLPSFLLLFLLASHSVLSLRPQTFVESSYCCADQGSANYFSVEGQGVSILGFGSPIVSVTTTQL